MGVILGMNNEKWRELTTKHPKQMWDKPIDKNM